MRALRISRGRAAASRMWLSTRFFGRRGWRDRSSRISERWKRCRRGVWPGSHVSSSASCSAPLSPQQWALGLAASRSSQVRGVVQQRRDRGQGVSASIFGDSEPGVSSDVASSGSCFVDTRCGDIYRFRLPCCQGSFLLSACNAICCGVSGEQESGAAAGSRSVRECRHPAVAGCRRLSGSPSPGSARVTEGPAEQDFTTGSS